MFASLVSVHSEVAFVHFVSCHGTDFISNMYFSSVLGLAFLFFTGTTMAAPVNAAQMGSKHNLYLATCTKRERCPLIILCPKDEAAVTTYTAVAYFANGPVEANRNYIPTAIATVSQPVQPWEGTQRVAKIGLTSSFSSNIQADGATLEHSAIAGAAQLDNEQFVCFKDGTTKFGGTGLEEYSCTADYWCGSLDL